MNTTEDMETIYALSHVPWKQLWSHVRWVIAFVRCLLVFRPDIIHWYSGKSALPLGLDLLLVRLLRIPCLVEWQGTDIRIPEVEFDDNPYYAPAYEKDYEHRGKESKTISHRRQRRFARAGFACAAPVGMLQYVQQNIFVQMFVVPQRIIITDYVPTYPDVAKQVPLIVHSPSKKGVKGTDSVLKAVAQLQSRHVFEFRLIHGISRDEALQWMASADIVLDQFVLGDRGMASLEAMAMGKPVICYIKPSLVALYPDSPIMNATPDTLPRALETLITNPHLRRELGERGRAYMEKYYDESQLAQELVHVYEQVIDRYSQKKWSNL